MQRARAGIAPELLELELAEAIVVNPDEPFVEEMRLLRQLGVRFAIDDYGSGHSSMNTIRRLPIGAVKIDRSFVRAATPPGDASVTKAIVAMAQTLGLDVVAKGVETVEQRAVLQAAGCPRLQGYYFARPAPAAELDWPRLAGMQQELGRAGNGLLPSLA